MFSVTCPSEKSNMGVYKTYHDAEMAILKFKQDYSDSMLFEIEEDYFG